MWSCFSFCYAMVLALIVTPSCYQAYVTTYPSAPFLGDVLTNITANSGNPGVTSTSPPPYGVELRHTPPCFEPHMQGE